MKSRVKRREKRKERGEAEEITKECESLGLSTSWNAYKYNDGKSIIKEITPIGFKSLELSFNLTENIVNEIIKLKKLEKFKILSLHNYCPIPKDFERNKALPDCYSIASLNKEIRKKAVYYTKRTIDNACRLQAKVVVLHCGKVEIDDITRELMQLHGNATFFEKKKAEFLKKREELAPAYFKNVLSSLEELTKYANKNNVILGIENRFYIHEIPSLEELKATFEYFKNSNLYYWHDFGHAQVIEKLGIAKQNEYLNLFANRLIGTHIHDVLGFQDHLPLISGDLNFKSFKQFLKNRNVFNVLEIHSPATEDEIIKSKRIIEQIIIEN